MNWLKTVIHLIGYAIQVVALSLAEAGHNNMVWLLWAGFVVIIFADAVSELRQTKRA